MYNEDYNLILKKSAEVAQEWLKKDIENILI